MPNLVIRLLKDYYNSHGGGIMTVTERDSNWMGQKRAFFYLVEMPFCPLKNAFLYRLTKCPFSKCPFIKGHFN